MMLQGGRVLLGSWRPLLWASVLPPVQGGGGVRWLRQVLLAWYRLFVGREILTHPCTQMGLKESSKGDRATRRNETENHRIKGPAAQSAM